jgi:hypothetical protein
MGIFFRTFAAVCAADAIDRASRRPQRYWYPKRPGLPRPGTHIPYVELAATPVSELPSVRPAAGATSRWDWQHPERPR